MIVFPASVSSTDSCGRSVNTYQTSRIFKLNLVVFHCRGYKSMLDLLRKKVVTLCLCDRIRGSTNVWKIS